MPWLCQPCWLTGHLWKRPFCHLHFLKWQSFISQRTSVHIELTLTLLCSVSPLSFLICNVRRVFLELIVYETETLLRKKESSLLWCLIQKNILRTSEIGLHSSPLTQWFLEETCRPMAGILPVFWSWCWRCGSTAPRSHFFPFSFYFCFIW